MSSVSTAEDFDEDENAGGPGLGVKYALPGDTIRRRHIATRAVNKRRIVVLVEGEADFDGYSIGLDDHSLQILELPSGDVSTISLDHIVSISDGTPFFKLSPEEKDIVDRRTNAFRKTSQAWLEKNWPSVYNKTETYRREEAETWRTDKSSAFRRTPPPGRR